MSEQLNRAEAQRLSSHHFDERAELVRAHIPRGVGARVRGLAADVAPGAIAAAVIGYLVGEVGGFFPVAWGWAACSFLAATAATLLSRRPSFGRLDRTFLGAVTALVGWGAASALWGGSRSEALLSTHLGLVYLAGIAFLLAAWRRRSLVPFLVLVLGVIVGYCGLALATRFYPEEVSFPLATAGGRLSGSFTYSNALGTFAAIGLLIAFALGGHRRWPIRSWAFAAAVPLALTLNFSYSRGSWLALLAGMAATFAFARSRRRLAIRAVVFAVAPGIAIGIASRAGALTRWDDLHAATREGTSLTYSGIALVLLAVVAAGSRRGVRHRRLRVISAAGAVALVAAAFWLAPPSAPGPDAAAVVPAGASPPEQRVDSPVSRLATVGSAQRQAAWGIAIDAFVARPIVGSGLGTFQSEWMQHRDDDTFLRNAHSLLLETLGELGVIGGAALLAFLSVPCLAARRIRGNPIVAPLLGAYVVGVVHSFIDWDWQMPGLMLTTLVCGSALVGAARSGQRASECGEWSGRHARVPLVVGFALILALFAISAFGLAGSRFEARALDSGRRNDWAEAERAAVHASRWQPWFAEPVLLQGYGAIARNDLVAARRLLKRAVRMEGDSWEYWYRLANVSSGAERHVALERAAALNPRGPATFDLKAERRTEAK